MKVDAYLRKNMESEEGGRTEGKHPRMCMSKESLVSIGREGERNPAV